MKTSKTKKRFLLSLVAVIACVAMLVGTTMAWFTDSVTSGKNKIVAGNLDIELEYLDTSGSSAEWKPVTENTQLFKDGALWEPGYTEVAYLKLSNKGNLALKYNLGINISDEVEATNVAGQTFKLSDYIKMGVVESANEITPYADRAAARAEVAEAEKIANYTKTGNMANGADPVYMAVVVFMPEEVGNEANYRGTTPPSIDLGVSVVATQLTSEADSFDNQYDAGTAWLGGVAESLPEEVDGVITLTTPEQLAKLSEEVNANPLQFNGKTIKLGKNMDMNNINFPTMNGKNEMNWTFDGNGMTIKNLKISGEKGVGLFNYGSGLTVKNLTIDHASVTGINQVGVICGNGICFDVVNCTVKNAVVTTNVKNNDDGDKAGAIVGYLTAQSDASIIGCTVENCTIKGYRDIGGVAGYVQGPSVVTSNTVKNTTVICDKSNNYNNYSNDGQYDVREIFGEIDGTPTQNNNTSENCKVIFAFSTSDAVKKQVEKATEGETVKLIPCDTPVVLPKKIAANVTLDGGKAEDSNISFSNYNSNEPLNNITVKNVTVYNPTGNAVRLRAVGNCTFESCVIEGQSALRETYVYDGTLSFVNCKIDGGVYGIHIGGANANAQKVILDGCEITGWNSFAEALPLVEIKNCTFHKGGYGCIRFYQNGSITNCKFDSDFEWIDTAANNLTITMTGNTGIENSKLFANGAVTGTKFIVDGTAYTPSSH